MKKIKSNFRKGELKIQVENKEDLWYLSQVIDQGDIIAGKTIRKIKIGEDTDRNLKIVKKAIFIDLNVEKTDFSGLGDTLRVSGIITRGPDDIRLGVHHTFNIEQFSIIEIKKEKWLKFQFDIIEEACSEKVSNILLVVMDREEAYFAKMKKYGYEYLSSLKGRVQKKSVDEKIEGNFYKEIISTIEEYDKKIKFSKLVIASPSFWKEDLMKSVSDPELKKRTVLATCSSVGKTAFDELLRREEIKTALKQDKVTKEIAKVEELLFRISKEGNVVYGLKQTIQAGDAGAVELLLLTDEFIQKKRKENKYADIESLMKKVDAMKGNILIVSYYHEGGKKLKGIGGIGALTRYRIG